LAPWQDTYAALLLRAQMLGKTRLALSPFQNHYWHSALYVTTSGLATSPMPHAAGTAAVELDLLTHRVVVSTSEGRRESLPLRPQSTREFFRDYLALLRSVGLEPHIWPQPQESGGTTPFDEDDGHAVYDPDAAQRCWRVLVQVDRVLQAFRGRFLGKSSPSHFWWGAFDIACTRFSGERAPTHPGGIPNLSDRVTRESYSHACVSAGWWPGTAGMVEEPAFYAYGYPSPEGFAAARVRPAAARWDATLGEWLLPYDAVRTADDPDAMLLDFLQSTYAAAADLGGWNRAALERPAS